MRWSVVIATWQRAALLRSTLDSLHGQSFKDFEVVVVSDGDDAPTRSLAESYRSPFPLRWFQHLENRGGFAITRNSGASVAEGDLLLFLDDDTIASPDLLANHDRVHAASSQWPGCVVFGRTIEERRVPLVSRTDAFMQAAWERALGSCQPSEGFPDLGSVGEKAEAAVYCGFNCSLPRALFLDVGGFDARLRSDEEMELGWRLYRRGLLFHYARDAIVRHQDTKVMHTYFARCWHASGSQDVYRVTEKGQRSTQLMELAKLRHGSPSTRMYTSLAERYPGQLLAVASALEKLTDVTGSRISFALWARLRRTAEYWNGVRKSGATTRELFQLAGPRTPILAFHSVSPPRSPNEAPYCTSPARFRQFLAWLRRLGRVPVAPGRWLDGHLPEKRVLLTFDDAYGDFYTQVLPAIAGSGIVPLVFVVVNHIGKTSEWADGRGLAARPLMTLGQMRELQKHGVVFGAHSLTHSSLPTLSDDELRRQVGESKRKLEDLLGAGVDWFAYPYGEVDRRVRSAVVEAGYKAAVTTEPGLNGWQDPLALKRLEIGEVDTPLDFALKVELGWSPLQSLRGRLRRLLAGSRPTLPLSP